MKRKEIEIGEAYAVYIERAFIPSGKLDYGAKEASAENHQVIGGVPKRYLPDAKVYQGTVVATDAPRWVATTRWYNNYKVVNDGVLVELKKPFVIAYGKTITKVVVQPIHVLRPWEEEKAGRAASKQAEKRRHTERERAVADRATQAEYYRSLGLEVEDPNDTRVYWDKTWDVEWTEYSDLSGHVKLTDFGVAKLIELVNGYKELIDLHWSPAQAEEMHKLVLARAVALVHAKEEEEENDSAQG